MESVIRRIRRVRKQGLTSYTVQVPAEWAERMAREGKHHVAVHEWRPGSRELTLTPMSDEYVAEYRLAKRRERSREYSRRRYRQGA